ncbi:DinB family protein [Georgenia yuyongxinii]|uniref:DinB family protein n=2 Tax=Georgenia yuyongxinii TaxID=2589797 RepID=A0A552WMG8_9MICO|nr:DinB family protein [Georgenia yuyongxinii]
MVSCEHAVRRIGHERVASDDDLLHDRSPMIDPQVLGRGAPALADELGTLTSVLDQQRTTVVRKLTGLSDAQARSRPVPTSTMTPMGLVRHLAAVERWWFSIDFAARGVTPPWPDGQPGRDGFELADDDTLASSIALYVAECAASRQVVAASRGLDEPARQPPDQAFNLRFALVHMIQETARHNGHLDLMREAIDGSTGE